MGMIHSITILFLSLTTLACIDRESLNPKIQEKKIIADSSVGRSLESKDSDDSEEPTSMPALDSGAYIACVSQIVGPMVTLGCQAYHINVKSDDIIGQWSAIIENPLGGESIISQNTQDGIFELLAFDMDSIEDILERTFIGFDGKIADDDVQISTKSSEAIARYLDRRKLCPQGYVFVPGSKDYNTADFCAMKYEAKNVNGTPVSQPSLLPWFNISQQDAFTVCQDIGPDYALISNAEWMTLATNLAAQDGNWSQGKVGEGAIFRGHYNPEFRAYCESSEDDNLAYIVDDCRLSSSSSDPLSRRTHILSTGDIIWDISGNIQHWTSDTNLDDKPNANNNGTFFEFYEVEPSNTMPLRSLIPTNQLQSFWDDTWGLSEGVGLYYPGSNGQGGAVARGGDAIHALDYAGIFAAAISDDIDTPYDWIGFRCILRL